MSEDEMLARLFARLAAEKAADRDHLLARLTCPMLRMLAELWPSWAHKGQLAPGGDWRVWLMMAGRGFGKTRAGAEWVSEVARTTPGACIALVGATPGEVERVMVRGESGLINVARAGEDVLWYPARGLVEFASGARAFVYSGANPDALRGPEHDFAWCDELAKWAYPQATWDNLMLGLRLGEGARVLVTTTPRPIPLLRWLDAASSTRVTRGRTDDNAHLPADYLDDVRGRYAGTRFERQELDGELIADFENALWTREIIERCRVEMGTVTFPRAGDQSGEGMGTVTFAHGGDQSGDGLGKSDCPLRCPLTRVVVGVDPPASAGGDACGIVVCGVGEDGIGYVLDDRSVRGLSPEGWARAVVRAAETWEAERVVVETNQGGEMVESVLRSIDNALPVRPVRARYGKGKRAEPVSSLFAQGKAMFAGLFPELEDELCGMTATGYEGPGRSPDRADAMVWAMAELLLGGDRIPRVRML
jgi:phage terminase large subunit-like protein